MDDIGPIGVWKYRSMMARISAAYADLPPDEESTLSNLSVGWQDFSITAAYLTKMASFMLKAPGFS